MEHLTLIRRATKLQIISMILLSLGLFLLIDYLFALHSIFGEKSAHELLHSKQGVVIAEVALRYTWRGQQTRNTMPTAVGLEPLHISNVSTFQEQFEIENSNAGEVILPRAHYKYRILQPLEQVNLLDLHRSFHAKGIGLRKLLVGGYGHYHFRVLLEPFCEDPERSGVCASLDVWLERRTGARARKLQNSGELDWFDSFVFKSSEGEILAYARYNSFSDVLELLQVLQLEGIQPLALELVVSDFAENS